MEIKIGTVLDNTHDRSFMNKISKIISITLFLGLAACQKVPEVTSGLGSNLTSNDGDAVKLCADGTLNCHVEFPDTVTPSITEAFAQCVSACVAGGASNSACAEQCDAFTADGILGDLPESDELILPSEPRKAIKVTLDFCADTGVGTEVHFQGTEFRFDTDKDGNGSGKATAALNLLSGGLGNLVPSKVHRTGRNKTCSKAYKNQMGVTWEPVTASSVETMGSTYAVVPFNNGNKVETKCKYVHSTSCGVPQQIREEIDMQQIAWGLDKIHKTETGIHMYADWLFVNNNIPYGNTIVITYPLEQYVAVHEKIVMYMFATSK